MKIIISIFNLSQPLESVENHITLYSNQSCEKSVIFHALGVVVQALGVVLFVDLHHCGEELGTAVRKVTRGCFDIGEEFLET